MARGGATVGTPRGPSILVALTLAGTVAVADAPFTGAAAAEPGESTGAAWSPRIQIAQVTPPGQPAAPPRFRYDARSGRCLDAEGREGHNPGSREMVEKGNAECADLSGRGLNLTYLRLAGANLRGANFANVPWYLGSITASDLTGANLSGTTGQMDYRGSRLREARLSGSDLTWADLRDADLDGADLRGARYGPHTRLPFDDDEARRRGMIFTPAQ